MKGLFDDVRGGTLPGDHHEKKLTVKPIKPPIHPPTHPNPQPSPHSPFSNVERLHKALRGHNK